MRRIGKWFYIVLSMVAVAACSGGGDPAPENLSLLAVNVNGGALANGAENLPTEFQLELAFSAALNTAKFESAFSLIGGTGNPSYTITYANASSKAIVSISNLDYNTVYDLELSAGVLGNNGQSLQNGLALSLEDASQNTGNFKFYSTHPIYLENAEWEKLKYAVIVVHGANRDADNYYNWLLSALTNNGLLENTILISPEFISSTGATTDDLYWNSDWREGQKSTSNAKISSFEAIDALLNRLSDKTVFPVLEKVIVTGHSSGALFTQVYGATNVTESSSNHLSFDYVVANSQYFYYPDNQRYNEQNNQFYTPTGCGTYNHWPLGYAGAPSYVTTRTETEIDANLLGRNFTYFLGNGTGSDSALNTSDCGAVLLGSSRLKRGEHIYNWLQTQYSGQNSSTKVIVNGIGHDGQGMYQSNNFKSLLETLLK